MTSRRNRGGFTLIELLVVIAVILLLAALALPALHRATSSARRAGCISNTHQMYTSFAAYAQNAKDHLPYTAFEYYKIAGRYDLKAWDPADWRCQNWYPHGPYHDMVYGDGRNATRSAAQWQGGPRLWLFWSGGDKCNIFF